MKLISKDLLSACSLLAATATLNAAPFAFNDGDLILGFQASSGTGTVKNVFFNLGSATTIRDNPNPGVLGTIGTTLTAQFGASWYTRSDVHFGVIGNLRGNANTGFGSAPAVNGDPSRTFYLSTATESPSAGTLIPAATYPGASLGAAATNLSGMETMIITLEAEANGAAILDQTTQSVEWSNGWSFWNPVPGAGFGVFTGGIQQSFGKGTPTTAVDIQRVLSTNTGAVPEGVIGGGTYVTTVSINSNGRISVNTPPTNPEIVVEQVPEVDFPDGDTQGFGSVSLGSFIDTTFTIKNTGGADLTGLTITKDGTHDSDFSVTVDPVAPVAGGGSTTFTVRFAPSAAGTRTAAIHIASNDSNENPFDINLTGTGIAPEIVVEQPVNTNIADNGSRDYGDVLVGTNANLTFTIKNTGAADLTGLTTTIDGADASDFTVTANPVAPVESGQSTTFTVRFSPSSAGLKTAAIHIANNDANEDPFDINLTGTGAEPEIAMEQPIGTNLQDGGSRSYGNVLVDTGKNLNFTIKNTGNSSLTGIAGVINGAHASDFTLTTLPATSIAPGGSSTFTVRFTPSASGNRTAEIVISNNDSDENPFNITLTGTGTAPEIAVEQPVGTNLADTGSRNFGNVQTGSSSSMTFTILNTGTASLTGIAITKDGPNAADFTVTTAPAATILAGSSRTFVIKFTPSASGSRSAAIHIANNDSNENPFDINLTGTGTAPEIAVEQPVGTNLPDGGSNSFGSVATGASKNLTFTIKNTGDASLTGIAITKDGTNASDFTVVTPPPATIAAGSSKNFVVRFTPSATGSRTAAIHIANNDSNENPFNITLTGTGIAPEIALEQPAGSNLLDGGSRGFGSVATGTSKNLTFTIKNTGDASLTGIAITKDGTNASDFTVVTPPPATILAGSSKNFVVRFTPSATGSRTAEIHIANNDSNENPFNFTLTGTGIAPEIAVEQPVGTNLADGGSSSYGSVATGSSKNLVFTIKNTGTSTLTGIAITKDGANPGDFIVVTAPPAAILAGSSRNVTIRFAPSVTGNRTATIRIANNDSDENPFDITLSGTGTAPVAPRSTSFAQAVSGSLETKNSSISTSGDTCKTLTTVDSVNGLKYKTLLVTKAPGTAGQPRTVEVSSDLLSWYSGKKHTTILQNDASVLKVRDNTPISQGVKRYIRLAP